MPFSAKVAASFSAASQIPNLTNSPCSRLHGYSYRVEAQLKADRLLPSGYMGDAYQWQALLQTTLEPLEHQCLNTLADFKTIPPTMEHLAQWIFNRLQAHLAQNEACVQLHAITLDNHMGIVITYQGDQHG